MSYPAYFDPGNWDAEKAEAFKASIMAGCVGQSAAVIAAWDDIADHLIASANLFQAVQIDGITQVLMQADNEADEKEMYLKFRIYQRIY